MRGDALTDATGGVGAEYWSVVVRVAISGTGVLEELVKSVIAVIATLESTGVPCLCADKKRGTLIGKTVGTLSSATPSGE